MSPMWSILGNRPIDQWKVIELKEELKRRKLPLRGLKDDLIRRLDEALRNERESIQRAEVADPKPGLMFVDADGVPVVETAKNMDQGDSVAKAATNSVEQAGPYVNILASPQGKERGGKVTNVAVSVQEVVDTGIRKPEVEVADVDSVPAVETAKNMDQFDSIDKSRATSVAQAGRDVNVVAFAQGKEQDGELTNGPDLVRAVQELVVPELLTDMSTVVSEGVVSERGLCDKESQDIEIQKDNGASHGELNKWESAVQLENDDLKLHPKPEDAHPSHVDVMLELSVSNNQVSEVSPTLGTQLKSESISTDSVSIKEKNELKDNIIADNVILELDTVKPEIVQPPSSDVQDDGESHNMDVNDPLHYMNVNEPPHPDVSRPLHPSDGSKPSFLLDAINESSHSLDVNEPHENTPVIADVEEINESTVIADVIKKNDSAELVYAEKLNLDRSSGEDSMEEDLLEGKQIDSEYIPDEAGDKNEQPPMNILKEDGFVDVVGDDSSACEKDLYINSNLDPAAPAVKRKLHEQGEGQNNEPQKRQRRWNSDSLNAPVPKKPNVAASTTPKDSVQPTVLRRNFSISESVNSEDSTKERIVPPSPKSPTNSLRIDQFLRPFTLKAVQELLGRTGTVVSFWMDHIKTHCYVTYSSVEEAMETRNAVYNLQWPANGGRLLRAEFVHPNEVKMRLEGPPQVPAVPVCAVPIIASSEPSPQPSPRNHVSRQHLPPPLHFLPPPPPVLRELPLPPPRPEKPEPPIVTLDDLFKKTKAIPRIYYLPLSDEQVAAKRAAVGQNVKR